MDTDARRTHTFRLVAAAARLAGSERQRIPPVGIRRGLPRADVLPGKPRPCQPPRPVVEYLHSGRRRRHTRRRRTPRRHGSFRTDLARSRAQSEADNKPRSTGLRVRSGVPRRPPRDTSGARRCTNGCRGTDSHGLGRAPATTTTTPRSSPRPSATGITGSAPVSSPSASTPSTSASRHPR